MVPNLSKNSTLFAERNGRIRISLRYKITGLVLLSLLIFGLLSALIGQVKMAQALRNEFISKGESIAQGFAKSSVELLIDQDAASIQSFLDEYIDIAGVAYVYILDQERKVIAHTFVPVFPPHLLAKNHMKEDLDISIQDMKVHRIGDVIDIGVPILMGSLGWVHVGMDKSQINREVRSLLGSLWIVYGLGIVLAFRGVLADHPAAEGAYCLHCPDCQRPVRRIIPRQRGGRGGSPGPFIWKYGRKAQALQ